MISFSIVRFHFETIVLVRVEGSISRKKEKQNKMLVHKNKHKHFKYVDIDKQNQQSHHVNQQQVLRRRIWSGAIRNFALGSISDYTILLLLLRYFLVSFLQVAVERSAQFIWIHQNPRTVRKIFRDNRCTVPQYPQIS